MAGITLVQHATGNTSFTSGTSGTLAVSFTSNVTAGNCVIACFTAAGDYTPTSSCTLNASADHWAQAAVDGDSGAFIWCDPGSAGGQKIIDINLTFGATASSTNSLGVMADVFEFSGLATTTAGLVDKTSSSDASSTSTSWTAGTTATTTAASELWIGTVLLVGSSNSQTLTVSGPSSPWTNTTVPAGSYKAPSTYDSYQISGYQIRSATGAATYNSTVSPAAYHYGAVATLKAAPAAPSSLLTAFPF